jgi:hypothetical protein
MLWIVTVVSDTIRRGSIDMNPASTGVSILIPQMPRELHRRMRLCAVSQGLSLKAWCIQVFEEQVVAQGGATVAAMGLPMPSRPAPEGGPTIDTRSNA